VIDAPLLLGFLIGRDGNDSRSSFLSRTDLKGPLSFSVSIRPRAFVFCAARSIQTGMRRP
jgi:hypothetical protein